MTSQIPGSVASCHTSLTECIFLSWGACKTIVVEPTTQRTHPSTPKICNFSSKIKWASTALIRDIFLVICMHRPTKNERLHRKQTHNIIKYKKNQKAVEFTEYNAIINIPEDNT